MYGMKITDGASQLQYQTRPIWIKALIIQLTSINKMKTQLCKKKMMCQKRLVKSKYQTIPYQTRKLLIRMVLKQNISVYRAAKELNINNSTAKVIVRNFKRRGTIFKRKSEHNARKTLISNPHLKERQQKGQIIEVQHTQQPNTETTEGACWFIWTYPVNMEQIYPLNSNFYFYT